MSYVKTYYKGSRYEYKFYYKDKKCTIFHREDGPAIDFKNGRKEWRIDGELHRIDGPAIEYANGDKCFYLNSNQYSEKDYWAIIKLGAFI